MTQKTQERQHTSENHISGIILAGGLSKRLGRDKSIEPIEIKLCYREFTKNYYKSRMILPL